VNTASETAGRGCPVFEQETIDLNLPGGHLMSQPDRSKLPIRQHRFAGTTNRTLGGSEPDWEAIGHVEPPDGAPNVLLVLIDDAGFGNAGTFGLSVDDRR
jgi:hypothetical protein